MRRINIVAFVAFAVLAVLVGFGPADALQSLRAYKEYTINIVVTPSPVAFVPQAEPPSLANRFRFVSTIAALEAFDLAALGAPVQVAQASVQPSPIPVQFVAKPDPNAAYLQVTANTTSWAVPYGTSTYACAFKIMTYYTTSYSLTDWGYGTTKTSGGAFPVNGYPVASNLDWDVPVIHPTVTPYANAGSPGETTWTGTAGQKQTNCIDLTITVPTTQPPGNFSATIQYNLYVS